MDSRYNAVIVGQTGVGKSTLINYLYGQQTAAVDIGKPVTKNGFHPIDFEINGLPVTLFDSWGLEVGKLDQWLQELKNEFKDRGVDQPADKWFHSVFYCIQAGGARIQDRDITIIKTFIEQSYKISVVLTKCDQVSDEVENELKKELQTQIKGISVISICSEEKKTRSGISRPFGKEDIENQAFSDFFDSLIVRLPLRCKSLMERRLKQWVDSKHDSINDLGFFGSGEEDLRKKIWGSAEKLQQKLCDVAKDECKRTLEMYGTFAARLGYPPFELNNNTKHTGFSITNKDTDDIPWWAYPLLIPLIVVFPFAMKGQSKDHIAEDIVRYKQQLDEIIDKQVKTVEEELMTVKSKAAGKYPLLSNS